MSSIKHPATLQPTIQNKDKAAYLDVLPKHVPVTYKPSPRETVDFPFFTGTEKPIVVFTDDASMAYGQALVWLHTRDESYALNAQRIIEEWSKVSRSFTGGNAPLQAAWGTVPLARAVEILKCTFPKWRKDVGESYVAWTRKTLMPHLRGETEKWGLKWGSSIIGTRPLMKRIYSLPFSRMM